MLAGNPLQDVIDRLFRPKKWDETKSKRREEVARLDEEQQRLVAAAEADVEDWVVKTAWIGAAGVGSVLGLILLSKVLKKPKRRRRRR